MGWATMVISALSKDRSCDIGIEDYLLLDKAMDSTPTAHTTSEPQTATLTNAGCRCQKLDRRPPRKAAWLAAHSFYA
jgi:hypothetical protein